jgi:hypothetical protein
MSSCFPSSIVRAQTPLGFCHASFHRRQGNVQEPGDLVERETLHAAKQKGYPGGGRQPIDQAIDGQELGTSVWRSGR